jgi:hypothetical protein
MTVMVDFAGGGRIDYVGAPVFPVRVRGAGMSGRGDATADPRLQVAAR